jgi:hypothetical protein
MSTLPDDRKLLFVPQMVLSKAVSVRKNLPEEDPVVERHLGKI